MTEIICSCYSNDFETDSINDFTGVSSSSVDTTNGRLTLADTTEISLNSLSFKEGYYELDILRSAASGSMNVYLADNYITINNDGAISFNGGAAEAYSIGTPSSIVTVGLLVGESSIAVYSNGVLKGTKSGLIVDYDTFGLLRATANWYIYNINLNAVEENAPNGISYGIPSVSMGGRYDTQESITQTYVATDILSSKLALHALTGKATSSAETASYTIKVYNATDDTAINNDPTDTTKMWIRTPSTTSVDEYSDEFNTRYDDMDDSIELIVSTDTIPTGIIYHSYGVLKPITMVREDEL